MIRCISVFVQGHKYLTILYFNWIVGTKNQVVDHFLLKYFNCH